MSDIVDLIRRVNSLQAEIDELVKPEITPGAFLILQDQKASGTNGGTFTSGAWRTRDLNTIVFNSIGSGFGLAANQITLPIGTYLINASAPADEVDFHKTRLQNITNGTTVVLGTSEICSSADFTQTRSILVGAFTTTVSNVFEIQHRCLTTRATFGLGRPGSFDTEVYTVANIWKIA